MGYINIGMPNLKGYVYFLEDILVRNRVSILTILVSNWVWFLPFSLELGMFSVFQKKLLISPLLIRLAIKVIRNTYKTCTFLLIENSFLRLYSPSSSHYNHLH